MGWNPKLSPKQLAQYRCPARYQLAFGARYTGKTWGLEHGVLRHCWRHDARFAIIPKTTRVGEDGIWRELTTVIFREWLDAGVCSDQAEFGWVEEPHLTNTKVWTAVLRNRYGRTSEIKMVPVERAAEARDKLFSTQFSGIWISEAHIYDSDEIMKVAIGQLRFPGMSYDDHRLFLDSNPPEEGKEHWLYEEFWRKRGIVEDEFPEEWDEETKESVREFRSNSAVFEFFPEDNPFADPRKLREFRAIYANNKDDFDRFVLGKWTDKTSSLGVFKQVWDPNLHVVGSATSTDPSEWEVLFPSDGPNAYREGGKPVLVGGWDPGEVNHAWVGLQPWLSAEGHMGFDVLEEFFVNGGHGTMPIVDMTREVLAKRKSLEEMAKFPLEWQDYGDSSALKARRHATKADWREMPNDDEVMDAGLISGASDGAISLIGSGAVKKKGWQQRRVNFIAQLLKERRIRVSANCVEVIRMFEKLRKDPSPKAKTFLQFDQREKHIFDALSYPICMMMLDQIMQPQGAAKPRSALQSV